MSLTKDGTYIFEQGPDFPQCVCILCHCLQKLEIKFSEIYELSCKEEAQIRDDTQLEKVADTIKFIYK